MNVDEIFKDHFIKYSKVVKKAVKDNYFIKSEHDDIVSDIWIKIYKRLKEEKIDFSNERMLVSLYFTIAKNHCIDVHRKHKRKQLLQEEVDFRNNESDDFLDKEDLILETLNLAEKNLSNKRLSLFNMRYIDGYSFKEISEMKGINETTCRVFVSRDIIKLKEIALNLLK